MIMPYFDFHYRQGCVYLIGLYWVLLLIPIVVVHGQSTNSNRWYLQQPLIGTDVDTDGDTYGCPLAIQGNIAMVAAQSDDIDRMDDLEPGAVFVFERSNTENNNNQWTEIQRIVPSNPITRMDFGYSLALENDLLVIGAIFLYQSFAEYNGAVYGYRRNTSTNIWEEDFIIPGPTIGDNEQEPPPLGGALSISGNTLAVAQYAESSSDSASVFIYNIDINTNNETDNGTTTTYELVTNITSPNTFSSDDNFGIAIALDDDVLVVGAPGSDNDRGVCYVYVRSVDTGIWDIQNPFTITYPGDSTSSFIQFCSSVSVDGNVIAIGTDFNGAYVYARSNNATNSWTNSHFLSESSFAVDILGTQVATSAGVYTLNDDGTSLLQSYVPSEYSPCVVTDGQTVVTGSQYDGALVYVNSDIAPTAAPSNYESTIPRVPDVTWAEKQVLDSEELIGVDDYFGYRIAIQGNTLISTSRDATFNGTVCGGAFAYERIDGIWTLSGAIYASDYEDDAWFGSSVAIDGNWLVIGSEFKDVRGGYGGGAVYVFQRTDSGNKWEEKQILLYPEDGNDYSQFGDSVAISNETIVVGSTGSDPAAFAYVWDGAANQWILQHTFFPTGTGSDGEFGIAVAISGDTIVVGAPGEDENADNGGVAYIFTRTGETWDSGYKLLPPAGQPGLEFGYSVAIEGDIIVIGSESLSDDEGMVYVYQRDFNTDSWSLQQDIVDVGYVVTIDSGVIATLNYIYSQVDGVWGRENEGFNYDSGLAMDISGDTYVSGSWSTTTTIYERISTSIATDSPIITISPTAAPSSLPLPEVTWTEKQVLDAVELIGVDNYFGYRIAIQGNTLISTSRDATLNGIVCGGAFAYERIDDIWVLTDSIYASDYEDNAWFGSSVDIYGDWLVIGSEFKDVRGGFGGGAVYVFQRTGNGSTWEEKQILYAPEDGNNYSQFGDSVAISDGTIVVGSTGFFPAAFAYVWDGETNQWILQHTFFSNDTGSDGEFGMAVAVSGDTIVVGAPSEDENAEDGGVAYIFTRTGETWGSGYKLLPPAGQPGLEFGHSVAIEEDTIVIGSESLSDDEGMVYVYQRDSSANSWTLQQRIVDTGYVVAIDGGVIATLNYVYSQVDGVWDRENGDLNNSGLAMDISGDTFVIGSWATTTTIYERTSKSMATDPPISTASQPTGPPTATPTAATPTISATLTPTEELIGNPDPTSMAPVQNTVSPTPVSSNKGRGVPVVEAEKSSSNSSIGGIVGGVVGGVVAIAIVALAVFYFKTQRPRDGVEQKQPINADAPPPPVSSAGNNAQMDRPREVRHSTSGLSADMPTESIHLENPIQSSPPVEPVPSASNTLRTSRTQTTATSSQSPHSAMPPPPRPPTESVSFKDQARTVIASEAVPIVEGVAVPVYDDTPPPSPTRSHRSNNNNSNNRHLAAPIDTSTSDISDGTGFTGFTRRSAEPEGRRAGIDP